MWKLRGLSERRTWGILFRSCLKARRAEFSQRELAVAMPSASTARSKRAGLFLRPCTVIFTFALSSARLSDRRLPGWTRRASDL